MSKPNHKSHATGDSPQTSARIDGAASDGLLRESVSSQGPLEPLAAKLAQLQPSASRRLQQKVFYEMGYQAGCDAAAVSAHPKAVWRSSAKSFAVAAACLCLAVSGGYIAGQRRADSHLYQSPLAMWQLPSEMPTEHRQPAEANTGVEAGRPQEKTNATKLNPSPRWWPQLADSQWLISPWASSSGHVRDGLRIGPVGAAWEDLVVSAEPAAGSPGAPSDVPAQPIDAELQQILQLSTPAAQPVQRLKKFIHPWL